MLTFVYWTVQLRMPLFAPGCIEYVFSYDVINTTGIIYYIVVGGDLSHCHN